jgi:hypothetical protein
MVIKKLIAISVVFALVAGAAFAVDLGGDIIAGVNVVEKTGGNDAEVFKGTLGRVRIEGSGEADIGVGTIGGWLRFNAGGGDYIYGTGGTPPGSPPGEWLGVKQPWDPPVLLAATSGLAWYQPIEQLRLQIGLNPDGHYDTSHIGRYGFYAQANELGFVNSDGNWGSTSWDSAVFGGYGSLHFAFIITPMEGVNINVAVPLNADPTGGTDTQIAKTFKNTLFQVNYAADFGAIHITYQGGQGGNLGKFWGSAYLGSLVDGLGLEIGVSFTAVESGNAKKPLSIGLAAKYDVSEQFGVKLRSIFDIPLESGGKVNVRVDLLPFYAINENVVAYFDAGIYLDGSVTNQFAWHFAPYVRVGAEWGSSFYAGLAFNNGDGNKGDKVNIAIPVGIIAKF